MWPWTIHITSLRLSFLIWNYGNKNPYLKWLSEDLQQCMSSAWYMGAHSYWHAHPSTPLPPQIVLQETFLMECLSSLTTYSPPTYALTYLSAQLPRFANFFPHANQYPALWILPPKSLIPFSPTTLLPPIQITTNSLLWYSNSLLTGIFFSSLCLSSIHAVRMKLLKQIPSCH